MKKFSSLFTTIILVLCGTIAFAANPAEDLIFHFPFDEDNGDKTEDVSPNGFEGTIKNGDWVEGVVGKALQFNNGAVTVPPFGVGEPQDMTIELWFKPTEKLDGGNRIDLMYKLSGGGRPHLTFNRGGILFGCYLATQAKEFEILSTYTAFEPQWYYLVVTQDQDKAVMYIDGKIDGEEATGGAAKMEYSAVGMSIGANSGSNNFFNGSIDEVKMWSVALTAAEVKKNMDEALAVETHDKLATTWGKIKSRN
jgi:hypothetical protein